MESAKSTSAEVLLSIGGDSLRPVEDRGMIARRPPGPDSGKERLVDVVWRRREGVEGGGGGREV